MTLFDLLAPALFIFTLIYGLKWLVCYIRLVFEINKIPSAIRHSKMIPFIGNSHSIKSGSTFFIQMKKEFAQSKDNNHSISRVWIGTIPVILFLNAESVEFLLNSSKHADKSILYKFLQPWLGSGLLTSNGEKWTKRRKLLTPSFHFDILKDFLVIMNEQSEILVNILRQDVKYNSCMDIASYLSRCTLDIICETAMGKTVNAQRDKYSKYFAAILRLSELVFLRIKYPWFASDIIFNSSNLGREHRECLKIIHEFSRNVINERLNDVTLYGFYHEKRIAFLDTLIKYKMEDDSITFDDIKEEVDTFMFEGHDTTSSVLSFACYFLAQFQDIQMKVRAELSDIFGDSKRHALSEDLAKMTYLECVIKETLRLCPPVSIFSRTITEDTNFDGYKLPKGTIAVIMPIGIHRDEKYFPNASEFKPDRFLHENNVNRHPYAYIPWSAGKRNCIGQRFALMEMKVVLSSILRNFKLKSKQKFRDLNPGFELIFRPKNGVLVELECI